MTEERSTSERVALLAVRARLAARAGRNANSVHGIRRAFNQLAQVVHPDHGGCARAFEILCQARDSAIGEIVRAAELRELVRGIELRKAPAPAQTDEPRKEIQ